MKESRDLMVRHRASGEAAIGRKAPGGCIRVQFNRIAHPKSHGWYLYPRHHFHRRRPKP